MNMPITPGFGLRLAWVFTSSLLLVRPIFSWSNNTPQQIKASRPNYAAQLCSLSSQISTTRRMRLLPCQYDQRYCCTLFSSSTTSFDGGSDATGEGDSEEDAWYENLDVLLEDGDDLYGEDTEDDWIPDAEKAKGRRPRGSRELIPAKEVLGDSYQGGEKGSNGKHAKKEKPSPYTEEEEELIAAMGGKEKKEKASSREIGFLGDSTLKDIARDYSIPICYIADVLTMWGVPVPINVHDRLGDLVTGEQAFALVEAVNTLDMGYLNDRYSNQNMVQVCDGWEIDISEAFQFSMKEGWSLPFGVRTNLRVEQEDELLRVFSTLYREVDDDYA